MNKEAQKRVDTHTHTYGHWPMPINLLFNNGWRSDLSLVLVYKQKTKFCMAKKKKDKVLRHSLDGFIFVFIFSAISLVVELED